MYRRSLASLVLFIAVFVSPASAWAQVQSAITSVTLQPNRSSPRPPGTTIRWVARAKGGVKPYSYKWWVLDGTWRVVQDWSPSRSYSWTPTESRAYLVAVWVRNAGSSSDLPDYNVSALFSIQAPIGGVTLTPDRAAPQRAGTPISWTATATGGTQPYSYRWSLFDGSAWSTLRDWTTNATYEWTPTLPNASYVVRVSVRSSTDLESAAVRETDVPFPINAPISSLTITADRPSPQPVGSSIRWTATAAGGTPPYSYKWWVLDGTWRTVKDWSSNGTFVWTPTGARAYLVAVWARSADNPADELERNVSAEYSIYVPIGALTLSSDLASPQRAGASVVWTASAGGGTPPYTFKWWLSDGSTWRVLQDWSASSRYVWTPLAANPSYTMRVWARSDGVGGDVPDREASAAYAIKPSVTDLSLTPDQSAPKPIDTPITWTATAAGGVPPYRYKWWLYDQSGWTLLQDWTNSATYTWRPRAYYGGYRIAVWAKSADNETDVAERDISMAFPIQRPVDDPGCSYTVVPTAITVGPENGTGEVHVTTLAGCPWTAAITSGGIVDRIEPTEGIGSATLTFAIANNTSTEPRHGALTVARQRIELTQAGRAPDPVCNYSLSSSLETIPAGGATRSVDVVTLSGCEWSASSSEGWAHFVGGTSGRGPGRLTYAVDANGGDGRNATLLIAGRGLDLLQVGEDPITEIPVLSWQDNPVSVVAGSIVFRPYAGYLWESYPNQHAPQLGECFGNCGAGCTSGFNPCGGRTQWWELQVLTEPDLIADSEWQNILCYGGTYYLYDFVRYRAMGRWVYHGHSAAGCLLHDSLCPEALWIGCVAFAGCGSEWDEDWSYEDVIVGSKVVNIQELGAGACE